MRRGPGSGSRNWACERGEEEAPEEAGGDRGGDPGEACSSGGEAPGEPGRTPQNSSSGALMQQMPPHCLPSLVTEQSQGSPVPLSPQIAWEVAPSRMTVLSSWDPSDEAKIRPQLVQGATCGAGTSFSCRTLYHPSFWPMYDASGGSLRPLTPNPGCQNGQQAPGDAGLPVMCSEDVFLLDPLLPPGQRIPLHLSEAPQQAMGPLRLLLPPPIMAPSACSPQPQACRTAWLSGAELIALTGLLQMSQGEPRPDSTPAGCTDSASDH